MTLGDFIKKYRNEHDLSQRQFANQCGLSNGYVSMLEKGKNHHTGKPVSPSIDQYFKLAKGMRITLQELMDSIDDDSPISMISSHVSHSAEVPEMDEIELEIMSGVRDLTQEQKKQVLSYVLFLAQGVAK